MALFSRGPSVKESLGYAIQALGSGFVKLDEDIRKRIAPVAVSAVKKYLANQNFTDKERIDMMSMFMIISGTVGIEPTETIDTYGQAMEIGEFIEEILPNNLPLMVMPPVRMVIEEFVTGQKMDEIDFEKLDKSDARQLIHALMKGIEIVNERCIREPKKHPKNEVICMGGLARVVAQYAKEQLY